MVGLKRKPLKPDNLNPDILSFIFSNIFYVLGLKIISVKTTVFQKKNTCNCKAREQAICGFP